jgi:hypothetical protein
VAAVESWNSEGGEFDHEHDAEVRLAYLRLLHPDGRSQQFEQPLRFRGTTAFGTNPHGEGITLEKVIARVCGQLGVPSVDSLDLIIQNPEPVEWAFLEAQRLDRALEHWNPLFPEPWEAADDAPSKEDLISLIDRAVSLGYRCAQAETAQRLRPFALSGLASARGAASAGHKSGEVRRRKAEETWHPQALELARRSRQMNPLASQDSVVADIQARWKTEVPPCPGTKTLKGFVSAKEWSGDLPRRSPA